MKHTLKSVRALAATLITLGSLAGGANAAVTATTFGSGASGNITIDLPQINFTATSSFSGGVLALVFDEAQPNSGNNRSGNFNGPNLGGGAINFIADSGYIGVDITQNDPYIVTVSAAPFNMGDTVSFAGGTSFMTSAEIDLDVFASGSYEVFLTDDFGSRLSANGVAVPEPTSALLLGFGALGIVASRRRIK